MLHVALTVGDAVEHIAARRGAKRISLILANLECWPAILSRSLSTQLFGSWPIFSWIQAFMRPMSGSTSEQRCQTSLPHAWMTPKSWSKPSSAIEGAAPPAINISATDNPAPINDPLQTV